MFPIRFYSLLKSVLLLLVCVLNSCANCQTALQRPPQTAVLIHAARLFDGDQMKTGVSVWVEDGMIVRVAAREAFDSATVVQVDLGDATLLPGLIELHAHLDYRRIPAATVLRHGITTVRDVGGPVHRPVGGKGSLRVLTSGPIITAPGGYPIPMLGTTDIAIPVSTEQQAREAVRSLISDGAVVIKIALEPGGESGAPWSGTHHAAHPVHPHDHQKTAPHQRWPLLSETVVSAIVDEAHRAGRQVTAHIGESEGAAIALNAGVDEWAHVPCALLPDALLKQAVAQQVKVVTTIDTLSKCSGVAHNVRTLAALDGDLLYGAEIAHPDIPWGIDAQELMYLAHLADLTPQEVLHTATAKAGRYLGIPLLGTIRPGAPADLIAVPGNPLHDLKTLEYPLFVMSGGVIVLEWDNYGLAR